LCSEPKKIALGQNLQGVAEWYVKKPTILHSGESVEKFLYFAVSSASAATGNKN